MQKLHAIVSEVEVEVAKTDNWKTKSFRELKRRQKNIKKQKLTL